MTPQPVRHSLVRRLRCFVAATCGGVLALMSVTFVIYEVRHYREAAIDGLTEIGEILGLSSRAALSFNDPGTAQRLVDGLRANDNITSVSVFRVGGGRFAGYGDLEAEDSEWLAQAQDSLAVSSRFDGDDIDVFIPIMLDGDLIGRVHLESGVGNLYSEIARFLILVAVLTVIALVAIFLFSLWLQRNISTPIERLASAMTNVSEERDFDIRLDTPADGEVGVLIGGFNTMIEELQRRDGALTAQRQRLEESLEMLHTSELRYRILNEHAPEGIIVLNYETNRIVEINRKTASLFGLGRSEIEGSTLEGLLSTVSSTRSASWLEGAIQDSVAGRLFAMDWEFSNCKDEQITCELRMSRVPFASESLVRISLVDISKQRQLEQEASQLGALVEESMSEIYVFDTQTHKFLLVNQGARQNLGYTADELAEMTPADINADLSAEQLATEVEKLRSGHSNRLKAETRHIRKDGSTYWAQVDLQSGHLGGREVYVANVLDVSDRRRAEDQLRQAYKMEALGHLTGGIAHDFNNLLTIVVGNLELLEETEGVDDEQQEMIHDALGAAGRGAELTKRLLAFARKQVLAPTPTAVNELVADMQQLLNRTLGEAISISVDLAADSWSAMVDAVQLENAVLNLAINARDAMSDGGALSIRTRNVSVRPDARDSDEITPGDYVQLTITDTGCGMSAEVLGNVFEPFFTTKEVGHGSGLGLSMVYGFVTQSGGRVTIDSSPGGGTSVGLYLPRYRDDVADGDVVSDQVSALPGGRETILVVDDNDGVRKLGARSLESLGYTVIEASSGESALEVLDEESGIDLIFSDVVMPGMTGTDLAGLAKSRRPDIKILFTTGYADSRLLTDEILAEGALLISKPYRKEVLAKYVRDVLDG